MSILLTGGAGYIGSHIGVELMKSNYDIIIVDNFSNSKPEVFDRIKDVAGKYPKYYGIDILDQINLERVFKENTIEAVIHLAGLKSTNESIKIPLKYYMNNITGTLILCDLMNKFDVKKIVFSSSAAVYGADNLIPFAEDSSLRATTPYGRTKIVIEQCLEDLFLSDPSWGISILRYFNPVGAHPSGKLGEDPLDVPNNLMPYVTQVAAGKRDKLDIFGGDYETHDGTGVRDFIHVVDLAIGHIKALEKVRGSAGVDVYNLGTGKGYSVLDVVRIFEEATGIAISYEIKDRRPGDAAVCYANVTKSREELSWRAEKNLAEMCKDAWRWQCNSLKKRSQYK